MAIYFSSLVDVTADHSPHVRGTQVRHHCRVSEVPVHVWAKRKRPNNLQRSSDSMRVTFEFSGSARVC